jgi:hypothetical protein
LTQHCDAHGTLLSRREDEKSILCSCLRSNLLDAGYAGGALTPHITVEEASFYVWLYPPCHFRSSPRGLKWSSWEYAWAWPPCGNHESHKSLVRENEWKSSLCVILGYWQRQLISSLQSSWHV